MHEKVKICVCLKLDLNSCCVTSSPRKFFLRYGDAYRFAYIYPAPLRASKAACSNDCTTKLQLPNDYLSPGDDALVRSLMEERAFFLAKVNELSTRTDNSRPVCPSQSPSSAAAFPTHFNRWSSFNIFPCVARNNIGLVTSPPKYIRNSPKISSTRPIYWYVCHSN